MFGFGKKKKEAAAQEASSADVYVAPATGEYLPLSEVSDPVSLRALWATATQ